MSLPYSTSGWGTHAELGQPRITYPIPGDLTARLITRTFQGPASTYADISLDAVDPVVSTAYFVSQGEISWVDGDQVVYERTYATIPATRYEPITANYRFIGIAFSANRRDPFSETVDAEIQHDYYLPGVTTGITTIDDIPSVSRQKYVLTASGYEILYLTTTTTPTRAAYEALVTAGTKIVAEDSSRGRWMGNIIERQVLRLKAQ